MSREQVKNIATIAMAKSYAKTLKASMKEVIGTCVSLGVTVEEKEPRETQREIDEGTYCYLIQELAS